MEGNSQKVLAGRYELHDRLGTGGMADVHMGRDRVLGRTVAVKTLLHQFATDPSFIARFRREAQSAASLNHPQIVGVYDTGSDDGTYYIVMEYIEGKTLRDVIKEEGPLLPERAAEIAADVCAALSFAHQHGIVHRDVKPANIMLTKNGSVKVTDFGIARAMTGDTVTQTAAVLGTAQYFSPEQAQAAPVDARSDIYSLGVVLYEMLTRQVPFTGSSPVAIAYKHVKEDPIPPSRLNPDVPPPLESIVMKALAKNPDNRYQSAQEMRADLQRAMQGKPVEATPILYAPIEQTGFVPAASEETVVLTGRPVAPGPGPQQRKRRTGIALLLLIALAIAGVIVWALLGGPKAAPQVGVPPVIGQKLAAAQKIVLDAGLVPQLVELPQDPTHVNGKVLDQKPDPGTKVDKGTTVQLFYGVNKLIRVPDLSGMTKEEAQKTLSEKGLRLGTITQEASDKVEKGKIVRQSIEPGTSVPASTAVNVTVSSGKETAIVPDVRGLTESDARALLTSRNFNVPPTIYEDSGVDCAETPGRVCKQSPEANKEVPKGSDVKITVAQEPGSPSPTPSSPSPTPSVVLLPLALIPRRKNEAMPEEVVAFPVV